MIKLKYILFPFMYIGMILFSYGMYLCMFMSTLVFEIRCLPESEFVQHFTGRRTLILDFVVSDIRRIRTYGYKYFVDHFNDIKY